MQLILFHIKCHKDKGKGRAWSPSVSSCNFGHQRPPGVRQQVQEPPKQHEWRKNIEVMKWMEYEKRWKKISNFPVCLSEQTASVPSVTKLVSDEVFEGEPIVM